MVDQSISDSPFPRTYVSYVVTATSTSSELRFGFQDPPGYFRIDDIQVTRLPEPLSPLLVVMGLLVLLLFRRRRAAP